MKQTVKKQVLIYWRLRPVLLAGVVRCLSRIALITDRLVAHCVGSALNLWLGQRRISSLVKGLWDVKLNEP